VLTLLVPLAATWTVAAQAQPAAPARVTSAVVKPTQELAALLSAHEAFAKPSLDSTALELVPPTRPLTGERTVLPVLGTKTGAAGREWLQVRLPGRPNSHTGWIKRHKTTLSTTRWHIVVDTSGRRIVVYESGRPVRIVKAVVGKPSTPTPHGEFFVEELIALRAGDVGAPFALALSARSNVLQEFDGGPGQIGLHGLLNVGGVPGTAASHGCVRLDTGTIRWLVHHIVPGVPVTIMG
jgi:lipoprotein-anchoring transpeptidase ErfK/SrfK